MIPMDITIGFTGNQRELTISDVVGGEDAVEKLQQALAADPQAAGSVELTDGAGRRYVLRSSTLAYVQASSKAERKVGFNV